MPQRKFKIGPCLDSEVGNIVLFSTSYILHEHEQVTRQIDRGIRLQIKIDAGKAVLSAPGAYGKQGSRDIHIQYIVVVQPFHESFAAYGTVHESGKLPVLLREQEGTDTHVGLYPQIGISKSRKSEIAPCTRQRRVELVYKVVSVKEIRGTQRLLSLYCDRECQGNYKYSEYLFHITILPINC